MAVPGLGASVIYLPQNGPPERDGPVPPEIRLHQIQSACQLLKGLGVFGFLFWNMGWVVAILAAYLIEAVVHSERADLLEQKEIDQQKAQRALMPAEEGGRFTGLPVVYTESE